MSVDEQTLRSAAANLAGANRTWVERLGKRTRAWDDLSCTDLELSVALPPNGAVPLGPPNGDMLDRVADFFAERDAGPYEIWSLWPIRVSGPATPCRA